MITKYTELFTTDVEEELKKTITQLINRLKEINPYELLCYIVSYMKSNLLLNQVETESDIDTVGVQMKYTVEIVQMLLTCIKETDFGYKELTEELFNEIISLTDKLFSLEVKYTINLLMNDEEEVQAKEYKAEDIMRLNITGKRYDIFEISHHKKILDPLKSEIENTYGINVNDIYEGIKKLKYEFNYGISNALKGFDELIKTVDLENPSEEDFKMYDEIMGKTFKLDCHDVKKITNWPENLIKVFSAELGDNSDFLKNITPENFFEIHNIINKKPIIKIEGNYYIPVLHRLLDSFDKNIFRDIFIKNELEKEEIKKKIATSCENYTGELFQNIIPTAKIFLSNYYKINKNFIENDILIEYDNYLFVIEVKAGSFTPDIAINNFESHKNALHSLIKVGDSQINRFLNQLETKKTIKIYEEGKKNAQIKMEIDIKKYKDIFKLVITLDGFNEIEARAEKIGIINLQKNIIVCSIDDLETYSDYFNNNPTEFIHYMRNRTLATSHPMINLNDELDHLGLYIEHNSYTTTATNLAKEYKDIKNIIWELPRLELDRYYNGRYFGKEVDKPVHYHTKYIKELISYSNNHFVKNLTSILMGILDMSEKGQEEVEYYISEMIKFYQLKGRPKHAAFLVEHDLIAISCIVNDSNYNTKKLLLEMYANLKISGLTNAYILILFYNENDILEKVETKNISVSDYEYFNPEVDNLVRKIKDRRISKAKSNGKIGRNEKCPCGSGKKYKKCCGK